MGRANGDALIDSGATRHSSGPRLPAKMSISAHQGYLPGCIGRIAQLHALFYSATAGFGVDFEAGVAKELAAFCLNYNPGRDGLWLAVDGGGAIQGSIAIEGTQAGATGAHLRWFITSDQVRGQGIGTRLLGSAMDFCAAQGYECVYLWTFDELLAARHLYEKFGFRLERAQPGARWGKEVNEQLFVRHQAQPDQAPAVRPATAPQNSVAPRQSRRTKR